MFPLCHACSESEHKGHVTISLSKVPKHVESLLSDRIRECRENQKKLRTTSDTLNSTLSDLSSSRDYNKTQINNLCESWKATIEAVQVRVCCYIFSYNLGGFFAKKS